jgi:hypothetical protein
MGGQHGLPLVWDRDLLVFKVVVASWVFIRHTSFVSYLCAKYYATLKTKH